MTSPCEEITVKCPGCRKSYRTWHRASFNLDLEDFDEPYMTQMSQGVCPHCGLIVDLTTMFAKGNTLTLRGGR